MHSGAVRPVPGKWPADGWRSISLARQPAGAPAAGVGRHPSWANRRAVSALSPCLGSSGLLTSTIWRVARECHASAAAHSRSAGLVGRPRSLVGQARAVAPQHERRAPAGQPLQVDFLAAVGESRRARGPLVRPGWPDDELGRPGGRRRSSRCAPVGRTGPGRHPVRLEVADHAIEGREIDQRGLLRPGRAEVEGKRVA